GGAPRERSRTPFLFLPFFVLIRVNPCTQSVYEVRGLFPLLKGGARMSDTPFLTVQQHILEEQRRLSPHASGEFSWLLSGITLAAKMTDPRVRRAGLADILGPAGQTNVQGEAVQKLDVYANQALLQCLGRRGNVAVMASEENAAPVVVERD